MASPQEHLPTPVIHSQKNSVVQLLSHPLVQITVPPDIVSNYGILTLLKKAATMTFEVMKGQENENYENAFRKGVGAALRMGTFHTYIKTD